MSMAGMIGYGLYTLAKFVGPGHLCTLHGAQGFGVPTWFVASLDVFQLLLIRKINYFTCAALLGLNAVRFFVYNFAQGQLPFKHTCPVFKFQPISLYLTIHHAHDAHDAMMTRVRSHNSNITLGRAWSRTDFLAVSKIPFIGHLNNTRNTSAGLRILIRYQDYSTWRCNACWYLDGFIRLQVHKCLQQMCWNGRGD